MNNTLTCPTCNYTLHGDNPVIEQQCNICDLANTVSNLSVAELWRFLSALKDKEQQGNYTYSAIEERIDIVNNLEETE